MIFSDSPQQKALERMMTILRFSANLGSVHHGASFECSACLILHIVQVFVILGLL